MTTFPITLRRLRNLFRDHWQDMIFGVLGAGALIQISSFLSDRFIKYRTSRSHALLRRYKKQQLFTMMEEKFGRTFHNWYDIMKENIRRNLSAEKLIGYLKTGYGNKVENWEELKMVAFTSTLALVYGSAMLSVILRIQVSAISGILFKQMDEVPPGLEGLPTEGGDACGPRRITEELQQEYMVLTRHLCTKGMDTLCSYLYEKARSTVSKLNLKEKLAASHFEAIFHGICAQELTRESEELGVQNWSPVRDAWRYMFDDALMKQYLYPMEAFKRSESEREAFLRALVCDAYDLVTSEDARTLLKSMECQGISHYMDRISDFLDDQLCHPESDLSRSFADSPRDIVGPFGEPGFNMPSASLAKVIPIMNSFVMQSEAEDTWATLLMSKESLKSFSANVYESYSSKEF